MKKVLCIFSISLFTLISLSSYRCSQFKKEQTTIEQESAQDSSKETEENFKRLKQRADSAFAFCNKKGFSTKYCYLVDFKIHSGKKRFYVWDFKGDSIKYASLCCHGYGKGSTVELPVFSNTSGSYCSSLGKYKVGARAYSQYGINVHYKLHGLESTNDNAFKRWVVVHAHTPVPENEIYPRHLPLGYSQGCPVINNETMKQIDQIQKKSKESILLWIYN